MKKRCFLVLICTLLFGLHTSVLGSDFGYYRYSLWSSKDGLPQNSINSIIQSKTGHLWFTTLEGLVRFDGRKFKIYNAKNNPDSFQYDRLQSVAEDENGTIWTSTEEGGLYEISQNDSIKYHRIPSSSTSKYITSILPIGNGELILGTNSGVLKYEHNQFSEWFNDDLKGLTIYKTIIRNDKTVWVCTNNGLYKTDRSTGRLILEPFTEGKHVYDFVLFDERNGALILTEEVYVFSERTFRKLSTPNKLKVPSRLLVDAENNLWIGTTGFGTWFWNKQEFINVNETIQIVPDVITSLGVDDEQNIWLGSNGGGIIKLTKGIFKMIGQRHGLNHSIIWGLDEDIHRQIWVSTYNGINRIENDRISSFSLKGVSSQFAWSVFASSKNEIYVAANSDGLFHFDPIKKEFIPVQGNLPIGPRLQSIFEDVKGTIWVGGDNGLAAWNGNRWTNYSDKVQNTTVKTFYSDTLSNFIIGTSKGIYYKSAEGINANFIPTFPKVGVRMISKTSTNELLFATEGYGLFIYKNGDLIHLNAKKGLYSNFISSVIEVNNSIWFSTNSGVFSISKKQFDSFLSDTTQIVQYQLYNELDGMRNSETNGGVSPNILVDEFQNIWYPTMDGIAILNTKKAEEQLKEIPRIFLDQVKVDGVSTSFKSDEVTIANDQSQLTLLFSLIHFSSPERFSFAYRLSNSGNWIPLGKNPELTFNELSSGKKVLHFSVWNQDNTLVNEISILLNKENHFTESSYFYVLMIFLGITLGYILFRMRIIQHKRNQASLNQLIHERTKALEDEKEKSERALLKLAKTNEQLKNANKMKNDFLSIAAHDLKNPLNGIMGFSELLIEEFESMDRFKQMAMFIQKSSEKMLSIIERLLEQGKMNDALLNLKFEKTDLSEIAWTSASDFFPIAKKKMQQIDLSIADHSFVLADSFWLRECIDNLISNALKYSPMGTTVHVRTIQKEEVIIFEIQDFGPGIKSEDQEKIFEPYKRLDHHTTGGESSTGLGLSIVKRVVDQHHGRIEIESEIGIGSTFRILIPIFHVDNLKELVESNTN